MLYLAIDQHRKQLTVNVRDEKGTVQLRRQVSTRWEAVRAFFTQLQQQAAAEDGYVAIVEVCGFNDWLLELLPQYGCREIVLVQPAKRSKRKTDRLDAQRLGELLWVNRDRLLARQPVQGLRRVRIPSPADRQDRQLTRLWQQMTKQRTRTLNRIRNLLRRHNLEQECPTKGLNTKAGRAWLRDLKLDELDRLELDQLLAQWKLWDEQLIVLKERVRQRAGKHPHSLVIGTILGRPGYCSLALGCRTGRMADFPRPRSLANYWGLAPGCRNSGEATERLGSITKEGSALARAVLGQMVVHVLRRDASIRAWHQRIKRRRGSKIARVAVMRRLTTIIWHMLRRGEPYMPGDPPRRKLKRQLVSTRSD